MHSITNLCDKLKPEPFIDWSCDDDFSGYTAAEDTCAANVLDYCDIFLDERTSSPILTLDVGAEAVYSHSFLAEEMLWMDEGIAEEGLLLEFD